MPGSIRKFKACINVEGVEEYRERYGAINLIYRSLQEDREKADISAVIKQLHELVDEAIETRPSTIGEERAPYDISAIDFDRLRGEFEKSRAKNTAVQNLKQAIETRLARLLERNPLRSDFQTHYERIVDEYNREKERLTIERTFEELLKFVESLDNEEERAVREGLDEESLAIFDLLKKPALSKNDIKKVKTVALELLGNIKKKKLLRITGAKKKLHETLFSLR
jgi:type I restriction enzyme R subunit